MKIRAPETIDIPEWSSMRKALWPDIEFDSIAELQAYFSGKSLILKKAFVVELDAELIGFIELNIRAYAEGSENSEVPYVEGWYIHPDFQGMGYAKALLQEAEAWALEQGYNELASDAMIENHKSISVHKHLGFVERGRIVCFLKPLG